MPGKRALDFSPTVLRKKFRAGMTVRNYRDKEAVFAQGDKADAVFYIQTGTVTPTAGLRASQKSCNRLPAARGSFFGEGCLGGQSLRICTARSIGQSNIIRLQKESMVHTLKLSGSSSQS